MHLQIQHVLERKRPLPFLFLTHHQLLDSAHQEQVKVCVIIHLHFCHTHVPAPRVRSGLQFRFCQSLCLYGAPLVIYERGARTKVQPTPYGYVLYQILKKGLPRVRTAVCLFYYIFEPRWVPYVNFFHDL